MAFQKKLPTFEEFIEEVKANNLNADVELISKAYHFAQKAHEGQKRQSGEAFFIHPLQTAIILIDLRADTATICAALLHDTAEDTKYNIDDIKKEFGEEIARLVEGLTKTQGIQFETKEAYKAENLRKILLATTKDVRVIVIRLADRLHNMRTLSFFREDKQKRIAKETLEIYAPIAHKLGMWMLKGELEDLSLRYLDYKTYSMLREQISEKRGEREKVTHQLEKEISDALKKGGIEAEVKGRAKYFYSIYKKMTSKHKKFDEIYDLIAFRIITANVSDSYKAVEIINSLFEPHPNRFKDYIAHPKANQYQSIHMTVGYKKKLLEVQIRTEEMHHIAEEGIAAHWRYKGTERDKSFDRKIAWLKQLLDWKRKSKDAIEFVESLKIDLFENEIIVFTPKGDPISLPEGATPVDFGYAVHTNVGHKCSKAKVNNKGVPLDEELHSGDVVEIITQNNAKPSRGWLNFARTSKARSKIRVYLKIKLERGREKKEDDEEDYNLLPLVNYIKIEGKDAGKKNLLKLGKCCEFKIGDPISGFYMKYKKISVHKKDCINVHSLDSEKEVKLSWIEPEELKIKKIRVFINDQPGILAKILTLFASNKINVKSVNTRPRKKRIILTFKVDESDDKKLEEVINKIQEIDDVQTAAIV
ncbi:bifunctional (p)ppGpp synthetase/guanosine-3',5'-bis(diphosphate) 3'-pyrophosphohydrolase [Candidatus Woesearchaeota archaeon]|jgi:GTP diphosphokinase / guanosine-3',5'-bis(diphosphate) 3'-diphosphatase|nr:bifunctional (p)ppGpp synthetase/guanosine-3',5'-bis(diphosphate) 3'-pyrophosphohydrolase [Candidatus Woesearchaeota archaeon]MBT6520102.1 bifunctional (p)ppGpp synthetase/guanosine-3',5'-bis(diphosphate) 3'-pyrophosphohydrolase [Candidatus Woesearchaeota archaeon]MBT7366707.1 bifunctional (p)ppGpp synthetase/guanosine-3',5'-bis(diphosphate) 3'-pyrophosphohydrolase [Candidatus Woesearchaeota archaeon]